MDTGIRRFEAKDIGPALALWRRLLAGMYVNPEPDEEFLRSKTFGNEQFDPEGSFVWDGEGKCAGVVLSFGDRPHENDMWWHTAVPAVAWIAHALCRGVLGHGRVRFSASLPARQLSADWGRP